VGPLLREVLREVFVISYRNEVRSTITFTFI
jgi:hypothetical protein